MSPDKTALVDELRTAESALDRAKASLAKLPTKDRVDLEDRLYLIRGHLEALLASIPGA